MFLSLVLLCLAHGHETCGYARHIQEQVFTVDTNSHDLIIKAPYQMSRLQSGTRV